MFILHSVEPVSDAHAGAVFCSCFSSLLDQRLPFGGCQRYIKVAHDIASLAAKIQRAPLAIRQAVSNTTVACRVHQ
jgi:hypothetical protein